MNTKYIILSEYVNLSGIKENSKELYQTYITGDNNSKRQLIPSTMFERGQIVEVELSQLDETALTALCSLEGSLAIVRIGTDYNKEVKKQGLEADLYKIQINNESKFTNTVMPMHIISSFCQNWEEQKAYILNASYSRYYLPLMDKFYLSVIAENNKATTKKTNNT